MAPASHGHTEPPAPGTQVHPSLQASTWTPPVPVLSPTRHLMNHTQERRQRQLQRQSDLAARQRAYLESNQPELRIARQSMQQQHSQQSPEQTSQQPSLPDFQRSDSTSQYRNEPPYSALGTREEIENADYQSPVGAMFGRAWDRYRVAEEMRRQAPAPDGQTHSNNPSTEQTATSPTSHVPHGHLIAPFMSAPPREQRENPFTPRSGRRREALTSTSQVDYREELQRQHAEIIMRERPHVLSAGRPARRPYRMSDEELALHRGLPPDYLAWYPQHPGHIPTGHPPYEPYYESESDSEQITFDTQERPPPMKPESMIVDLACTICKEHLVDTVVMPCMHAVMCNWCAELQIPGKRGTPYLARDRTAKCPLCRARVKEKRKIFHS
jgi:Zinc finger, C3HC4 type (RING finger)